MNVNEALLGRRTIHTYQDKRLPEGVLDAALEAAIWAPNHKLTNPWRFVLVGPESRSAIIDIIVALKVVKRPLSAAAEAQLRAKVGTPPVMIAAVQVVDADPRRAREDYASMACAIQNLSLSLWANGVGSKWSTTFAINDPRTERILGITSGEEEVVGFIYAGYPETVPQTQRIPISEVVRKVP